MIDLLLIIRVHGNRSVVKTGQLVIPITLNTLVVRILPKTLHNILDMLIIQLFGKFRNIFLFLAFFINI